jgi:flagellar biosynthesis protein FlhA
MADARRAAPLAPGARRSDVAVAIGVVAVVMMMIIPLPAFVLDALMSLNLVLSLLIILIVLYTRHALEFSVFPTLLLVATVFGLALNVSSTRLILVKGSQFNGRVIRAFGTFVVGTGGAQGYVIGLIIFIIIIAVQRTSTGPWTAPPSSSPATSRSASSSP